MFVCMSASNDISDLCLSIWLWQDWIKYYGKMCQVIFSRFVWQPLYFCCRVKSLLKKIAKSHKYSISTFLNFLPKPKRGVDIFPFLSKTSKVLQPSLLPFVPQKRSSRYASPISKTFFKRFPLP